MEVLWLWLERISAICGILGITVLGLAKLLGTQPGKNQIPERNTQKYDETGNRSIDAWVYIERIGAVCSIVGGIGFAVNVYVNLETANSQMPVTATTEIVQNIEGLQSTHDEVTDLDKPSEPLSETERESFSEEESLQTTLEERSSESPVFPTTAAAFPVPPETSIPIVPPGPSVNSLPDFYDSQLGLSADNEDVPLVFVDDVTGIEVTEAKDILERAGLTCNIIYPSGEDNWNGWAYVVKQEPCADYVPFGSSVTLNVETEEEQWWEEEPETSDNLIEVPNVISFTQDEAVSLLTDLGLGFQVWWNESDMHVSEEESTLYLMEQSIAVGDMVEPNTVVRLHITQMPDIILDSDEWVTVPDVLNDIQEQAAERIHDVGLFFQVYWYDEDFSDDSDEQVYVIGQSAPAGVQVRSGTRIRLHVADHMLR